jgi:sugar transferase EpsL
MMAAGPGGVAKRGIDVVGAAIGLLVLSPVLLVVAALCRVRQGAPVLHRARRAGWGERPFALLKLRTMSDARDPDGGLLPDAERITSLGRRLRSLSLDELPQLWNVLRGDMSLVGPRPLPVAYLERYTEPERRRHDVRPGMTGWAQINGRNAVDWDERLALDVWYVEHRSLGLDLRILARTFGQVLHREGISATGQVTMGELRPELATGPESAAWTRDRT